jgi:hypothetical protein
MVDFTDFDDYLNQDWMNTEISNLDDGMLTVMQDIFDS